MKASDLAKVLGTPPICTLMKSLSPKTKSSRTDASAPSSTDCRDYLRPVVDTVVVNGDTATISRNNAKLMRAVGAKMPVAGQVPSFIHDWCARKESNSQPPD
jgi:hypothetical protein